MEILNAILELAKSLLGMSDQLKAAERQQKSDLATLFEKIGGSLAATSSEIRSGKTPHNRAEEINTYAEGIFPIASKALGEDKANELKYALESAYWAKLGAFQATSSDLEPDEELLKVIEEASGKFQALANLVRL